jgi:hypothetical protein
MFLLIFGIPQSCFEAAMIWGQVKIGFEDLKRYKGTFPRLSRNIRINQTQPGLCWQEVKEVIDDFTIHRRARMVFVARNPMDISDGAKILSVITTHLSRGSKKRESFSKKIKVAGMKFEVNETTDITQAQNQACCSR